VSKAEAEAFAQAVMSKESAEAEEGGRAEAAAGVSAPEPTAAPAMPSTQQAAPAPAEPAPVSQPTTPRSVAPPAMSRAEPPMRRAAPQSPADAAQAMQARRAELMAQYEAMRKQAMEEAQKRWQQYYNNRPPMPMGPPRPPMYPGYAPGRAPAPAGGSE
jgi:hypothetical protein